MMDTAIQKVETRRARAMVRDEDGKVGNGWTESDCPVFDLTQGGALAVSLLLEQGGIFQYQTESGPAELSWHMISMFMGTKVPTQADVALIAQICIQHKLNLFLDISVFKSGTDLVKIHINDGAFMRRADRHPDYQGYAAGWIIAKGDGKGRKCIECGQDIPDGLSIVGAWCRPKRKGREIPATEAIIKDYKRGSSGIWVDKPTTMIAKVARHQAHRLAFPDALGGLYSNAEMVGSNGAVKDEPQTEPLAEPQPLHDALCSQIEDAFEGSTESTEPEQQGEDRDETSRDIPDAAPSEQNLALPTGKLEEW